MVVGEQAVNRAASTETELSGLPPDSLRDETPQRDCAPSHRSSSDDLASTDRCDDDDDDDDDYDGEGNSTSANGNEGDDALLQAILLKEEGNGYFQNSKWDQAARCYRRGANRLKKVSGIDADPQVKPLQMTLQTNLSMVLFKQEKYRASRDVASKVLAMDQYHVKALYRRAVAYRAMGDLDEARSDLRAALTVDSNNVSCKRELAAVKKQLEISTQQQKSALAKAFSAGGKSSFLYDDKEEEERQKQLEKERKKLEKEKRKEERKRQWEDECVNRMAKGGEAISFEEWEKEQEALEKKSKDAEKKKREAERKQRHAAQKSSPSNTDGYDNEDDDELTEQELASLRGYKKTKDGRTTSYFTRELSEEERKQMGDTAPKKLNHDSSTTALTANSSLSASSARVSAWNQAGTWEEKDCTSWCKDRLIQRLLSTNSATTTSTSASSGYQTKIVEVKDLTGEGSVAITGGKKRYIFDFHANLKYEIYSSNNREGNDAIVASSFVRLPDICSTHYDDDELEVIFDSTWSKAPSPEKHVACMNTREQLANDLRTSVQGWVQEFNQQF